jgi:hypothetical protein
MELLTNRGSETCRINAATAALQGAWTKGSRRNNFRFWRDRRYPFLKRVFISYALWRPQDRAPSGPLALLLAPYVPRRVRIVARASPAGLGACSRM